MSVYERALVALDFSEASEHALAEALKLVDAGDLHVVHVLRPLHPGDPGVVWDRVTDEDRIKAASTLMAKHLQEKQVEPGRVHVVVGDPGNQIAKVADKIDAQVVVVASHGRTGLSHLLLGSVAERVARLCSCPVLITKRS